MSAKVTARTIEFLIGLNEKNEERLRKMSQSFSKKLIKAYFSAIEKQSKQAAKAKTEKQEKSSSAPIAYLEPAVIAS